MSEPTAELIAFALAIGVAIGYAARPIVTAWRASRAAHQAKEAAEMARHVRRTYESNV